MVRGLVTSKQEWLGPVTSTGQGNQILVKIDNGFD
jgi:hypothetical protein